MAQFVSIRFTMHRADLKGVNLFFFVRVILGLWFRSNTRPDCRTWWGVVLAIQGSCLLKDAEDKLLLVRLHVRTRTPTWL